MRIYNLLLRLYPASFRNEYGAEMRPLFERRRAQARGFQVATLWLSTIGEMVANAAAVHMDVLEQDLSYTGRVLRRSPGFAMTAVLIVALGVGATTAAFSVTDFVLLRPLPFPEPGRIVTLWEHMPKFRNNLSAPNFRDWTSAATSFERAGMYHLKLSSLVGTGDPVRIEGASVSVDVLTILGASPVMGRVFAESDDRDGAPGTLLLSYRLWQTQFGGDPNVIGRKVLLDDESFTVVGVMPGGFSFPTADSTYWTPLRFGPRDYADRNNHMLNAIARLRRGVTIEQARAEMDVITARSRQEHPVENKDAGADVLRFSDEVPEQSRLLLYALCGASGCVLLLACANFANLLLARALSRRRELAVRTAIGAGRERMIRQLLTESLLLAGLGGACGVLIAYAGVPLLNRLVPVMLPLASAPTVDLRALLFSMALTVLTGLTFGLAPVLRVGGEASLNGLREGSRSGGGQKEGARSTLVVVEIVASVVLLVSAGLLLRALLTIQSVNPGFRADGVLTMQTPLPMPKYAGLSTREAFYTRVLTDLRALPGVTNAAFVSFLPMGRMRGGVWPVGIDGQPVTPHSDQSAYLRYVTPGYFATIGTPLRSGRDIAASDTADRPFVVTVSESFVKRYWPNETMASVIGRRISFAGYDRTVVGVVGEIRMRGLENVAPPQVYMPSPQVGDRPILGFVPRALVVRSTIAPESLTASIRAVVRQVDPMMPVAEVNTLTAIVERDTVSRSTQVRVLGGFAVIAFVLAAIGIHGLLSFAVSQRTQEIGVRMALGAQAGDIVSMVVRRCVMLAIAGVVPGIAIAYAAGRSMEALLAGVKPADALTLAGAVALSVLMTIAGSLAPTLRALRVDPMTALRAE